MAIPATYTVNRAIALPGQIADTSLYNIDGVCAADGDIPVGIAIAVTSAQPIDGHKVVKAIAADQVAYGVTIISHALAPEFKYEDGCATNVMTHGRVWMKTKDKTAPAFGKYVKLDVGGLADSAGTLNTNWTYAGGFTKDPLDKTGATYIVEVQILQSSSPVV